jgi:hypothetical protein
VDVGVVVGDGQRLILAIRGDFKHARVDAVATARVDAA